MQIAQEIKKAAKAKKLIIGKNTTIRGLKVGTIQTVICASNCPVKIKRDLDHYTTLSKIKILQFKKSSVELGEACGKTFNVLLAGIKK